MAAFVQCDLGDAERHRCGHGVDVCVESGARYLARAFWGVCAKRGAFQYLYWLGHSVGFGRRQWRANAGGDFGGVHTVGQCAVDCGFAAQRTVALGYGIAVGIEKPVGQLLRGGHCGECARHTLVARLAAIVKTSGHVQPDHGLAVCGRGFAVYPSQIELALGLA